MSFRTHRNMEKNLIGVPRWIEYSSKDDKFRIQLEECGDKSKNPSIWMINISRLQKCEIIEDIESPETRKNMENTEEVENIKNIQDRKNTLYQRNSGGMSWIPVGMERKSVTMEITDDRNALERVLIHFSPLEKETKKISDRCYHVKLTYDVSDETEMLIRILSFGPVVKVLEPQELITKIRERLERQLGVF